jgi:hypothetical protein
MERDDNGCRGVRVHVLVRCIWENFRAAIDHVGVSFTFQEVEEAVSRSSVHNWVCVIP